jgi:hypothetical protein
MEMAGRLKGTPKTGGRKAGTPNKRTVALRVATAAAADQINATLAPGVFDGDAHAANVDLVYFDATDLSLEAEVAQEQRLRRQFKTLPVQLDVKNEARVPLWYHRNFGYSIPPCSSTKAAIDTFPTTATSIGVRRRANRFECYASFGLDDLFALAVRPNKAQVTAAIYKAKLARWREQWPQLTYLDWDAPTVL